LLHSIQIVLLILEKIRDLKHEDIALSVGVAINGNVQIKLVLGVGFTMNQNSGFGNVILQLEFFGGLGETLCKELVILIIFIFLSQAKTNHYPNSSKTKLAG